MKPEQLIKLVPKETLNGLLKDKAPEALNAMLTYLFNITDVGREEQGEPVAVCDSVTLLPTPDGDIMAIVRGKVSTAEGFTDRQDLATYSVKRLLATIDLNELLK